MDQKSDKLKILEQILDSKYFSGSPSSSALLKFLVESTIKNIDIKESVIGLHFFGDRYDGEKSNARIRVSVYHLRKKLEQYYENEGAADTIRLTIEKGQYSAAFIEDKSKRKTLDNPNLKIHLAYIFVLLLLLLGYILALRKSSMHIWDPMFSNDRETVFYIGDVFGYIAKTTTGGIGWQRDYEINSVRELRERKKELSLSDVEIQNADYSYVTASEIDAVKKISKLYYNQKKDFTVRLASKLDIKNIKEQNIIYAGPIKTNNRFVQILTEQFPQFRFQNYELHLSEKNKNEFIPVNAKYRSELMAKDPSEIAIVASINSIHNTQQIFFFSDHDLGVRATVDYFTNTDSLNKFQKTYLNGKANFTAIFLVNGKERIDFGMELLDVY